MQVGNANDIDLGGWSGQTLIAGNDNVCVRSDFCLFGNFCFGPIEYAVTVLGQGASGTFVLSNGIDEIPMRVYFNNASGTTDRVELFPGVALTDQTGAQTRGCSADNGNYSVELDRADLLNASAGNYRGVIDYEFENDIREVTTGQWVVDVNLADLVQIIGLDDLGLSSGEGAYLKGGDDFCVYRNGGVDYSVNVRSGNGGAAGVFILNSGADAVNYEVFYDDQMGADSNARQLSEGNTSGGFTGSGTYSAGCTSQNASIFVRVRADLLMRFGSYSDVLTIEVVPE